LKVLGNNLGNVLGKHLGNVLGNNVGNVHTVQAVKLLQSL
jgi:hypothetical protein